MKPTPDSALLISEKESEKRVRLLLDEWESELAPKQQPPMIKKPKQKTSYSPPSQAKHINLKAAQ